MRLRVVLSLNDFESVLHWYYVYKNSEEPTIKDKDAATKLEALFISEREDDAMNCDPRGRMEFRGF